MVFHKLAYFGYLLVALASLALGVRYSLSNRLMPYQLEALKATMDSLEPGYRILLMNFMKSYAAGWIIAGISMLFLLHFPFRNFEYWSYWAIAIIAITEAGIIAFRTYMVKVNTEGTPPLTGILIMLVLVIISFVFSLMSLKTSNNGISI